MFFAHLVPLILNWTMRELCLQSISNGSFTVSIKWVKNGHVNVKEFVVHIFTSGNWRQPKRLRLLFLIVLVAGCLAGFIATRDFVSADRTRAHDTTISTPTALSTSNTSPLLPRHIIPKVPSVVAQPDPSGQKMPLGNLPGWHQIFTEDFTTDVPIGSFPGSVYGGAFSVYPNGTPDTAGQQGAPSRYDPSQVVSVKNGLLNLYLHTSNGTPMAAAILPNLPGKHLYGKYTIRFRSQSLAGFKTAWLLWPDSENWPQDGEIDFPEGDLSGPISGYVHHQGATDGGDQDIFNTSTLYTSWHTASIEWKPNGVKFILDGKVVGSTTDRVPNTPMHWVIQTESCFDFCPAANTKGNLQIAWITAYSMQ
jgi:hypothetical protein